MRRASRVQWLSVVTRLAVILGTWRVATVASDVRLLARRVEVRQKTEAEFDLPPNCVVTGLGARAHVDNITTFWVEYRPVLSDGTLGEAREKKLGSEPDHASEAKIVVPEGWVVVGFGARGAPEWDVATFRVWGRPWDPRGRARELRVWSDGREPDAGLERSVLLEEPDRVLVGVGLRFHHNDIQGIYARSARIEHVTAGDHSFREADPKRRVSNQGLIELFPSSLGPVPLAAVDADRIQGELLAAGRRGQRVIALKDDGLEGTGGALAIDVCRSLMTDPFADPDEVLRGALGRLLGPDAVEVAARALRRVPMIARLAYSASGQPFLGRRGIPTPSELPDLAADDRTLQAIAGEKETARWLLVQSRAELTTLANDAPHPWLDQATEELERLARAADVWERLVGAEVLSRMYLIDGAAATRDAALEALANVRTLEPPSEFGDAGPLEKTIVERLATPQKKTELGAAVAEVRARSEGGKADPAAAQLAALLGNDRFQSHLGRHGDTVGELATTTGAFGIDPETVRVLWGGDGRWSVDKRAGRWAWVTTPEGPCVYVEVTERPARARLRFQYLDDGEGTIHVHYNSVDPVSGDRQDYRPAPVVEMQGAGGWREAEVTLDHCEFFGRQNLSADLRLIPDRRGVALRAVAVTAEERQGRGDAAVQNERARWTFLRRNVTASVDSYLDTLFPGPRPPAPTREAWQTTRREVRDKLLWSLGLDPLPAKLPLRTHIAASLQRDGYELQRIYWQTWPDVYASGWLYVPAGLEEPAPAVLCPHGHWAEGARHATVQSRCIGLAKLGYVVLAVDSVHYYDEANGVSPISVMTWNNIRGIDLLTSRRDLVDPKRIGCTGASGGGQQTMYLMAVDDRITAAAPVVLISYWRRIIMSAASHCRCNHVPTLARFADEPDLCAVFAPKPSLYICVTGDWTKNFPVEGFPEIQHVYRLYDAADKTACRQFDCGHDYSKEMRELVYAFFARWLQDAVDPGAVTEPELKPESLETLRAMDGPPPGAKAISAVSAEFHRRRRFRWPQPKSKPEWREQSASFRDRLSALLGHDRRELAAPQVRVVERETLDGASPDGGPYRVEKLLVTGEGGLVIPTLLVRPLEDGRRPAVIVLDPGGKVSLMTERRSVVNRLLESGIAVVAPDLRFRGELSIDAGAARQNGLLSGRTSPALAADDVARLIRVLGERSDIAPSRMGCLALGDVGVEGLIATSLDSHIAALAVPTLGPTYLAGRREPPVGHVLTVGDLPQVAATLAPRPVLLGSVDVAEFETARAAFTLLDSADEITMSSDPFAAREAVDWLGSKLRGSETP